MSKYQHYASSLEGENLTKGNKLFADFNLTLSWDITQNENRTFPSTELQVHFSDLSANVNF